MRRTLQSFCATLIAILTLSQPNLEGQQPPKPINPTVDAVTTKLWSLTHLEANEWRYHAGDIPHGEDVALDDNTWTPSKTRSEAPEAAVWYRRWIVVPPTLNGYDLSGGKLWFRFAASANGPIPQIVYFNGRRVAMGEDLEPIILLDPIRPGDKVLIAVKLLQTVDKKHFDNAEVRVEFAPNRPSPLDLLQEIQIAAALAPSSGTKTQAVEQALTNAANSVDLAALASGKQSPFDASLEKAHSVLTEIKPELDATSVRMAGNAHIDAAWLWPWTETVDVVRRTFTTSLQLMAEYPQYTYTQSAAAYNQWMEEKYPALHQQIIDRVKEGRWEMVGGMWVEPDLNMPDGESLVRQLLQGKRYFKERFGVDIRIGWNPDSFGYNWQLPQIYKKSGIDYFVTQKMAWNDTNKLPLKLFWWQSPDGSRVLSYFPHDYVNYINPPRLAEDIATARTLNPGTPVMLHLYGIGDHGGGPTRSMLDSGIHWTKPDRVTPPLRFSTAQGFLSDIETKLDTAQSPVWNYRVLSEGGNKLPIPPDGKLSLPIWNDELYFEYHRGVMTTQASHKRNMRESEEQLLNAEKYSSLAWLFGNTYPSARLNEAWQKTLFNQFHDLAAGSGIGVIYKDAQQDYDVVRWITEDASTSSLQSIAARIRTLGASNAVPVLAFNPLAWTRTDLATIEVSMPGDTPNGVSVIDSQGHALLSQVLSHDPATRSYRLLVELKDVPSLGYEVLQVVPSAQTPSTDISAHDLTLENSALRVSVDPKTGCITGIYQKATKFETLAAGGCGNQLQTFKDTPKEYDAWNIDANFADHQTNIDSADSVELTEKGPLRATIRVSRKWQNSRFVQDISLYANLDRVDVANQIDWHETHVLLKAAFPLAASSANATYEIPYGTIDRPTTRNNSWEKAKFEVPALRWADLGDGTHGFTLINESKYGYDAKDNVLRLSLLRSPTWPDPDADRGTHNFSYSLYPHSGDWKAALTVRRGYEFNYALRTLQLFPHEGSLPAQHSFLSVGGENVVLTALKKTEDGNALLLRLYDWSGKNSTVQVQLPEGATAASLTNLMEKPEGSPLAVTANKVSVPVKPHEIASVRVEFEDGGHTRPK
jgi:alpha-mannosidase